MEGLALPGNACEVVCPPTAGSLELNSRPCAPQKTRYNFLGKKKPEPRFQGSGFSGSVSISDSRLLAGVNAYATVYGLRLAVSPRRKRHVYLVKHSISCDAMSVAIGRDVLQPLSAPGINHA